MYLNGTMFSGLGAGRVRRPRTLEWFTLGEGTIELEPLCALQVPVTTGVCRRSATWRREASRTGSARYSARMEVISANDRGGQS